jgi:hypothetical protein
MTIQIEASEEAFRRCAIAARLITAGDPLSDRLRTFALLVAAGCAELVDGLQGADQNAGDVIRQAFLE